MPGTPEHMARMRSLRQQRLTPERRSAIARQGANGRWSFAKGGDIGRVNAMQRQLALVMLSALKDRDGDKALRTSLVMLQWEKHRLALRANAPKRVKNDWWRDYIPVSTLSEHEQESLARAFPNRRYVRIDELSPEEHDRLIEAELDEKFPDEKGERENCGQSGSPRPRRDLPPPHECR
jgi:hypothetical protein